MLESQFLPAESENTLAPNLTEGPRHRTRYVLVGLFVTLLLLGIGLGSWYYKLWTDSNLVIGTEGLDSVREKHRGAAATKVLRSETSPSGYVFILTEYDKSQMSNNCNMFVSNGLLELAKQLVSCEVKITTTANSFVYTDEQLKILGGLPDKWISGSEIITSRVEGGEGMGETAYKFVGTFNVDTEKYTEILKIEQPGFYWRRALIDYEFESTKKRFLFVEGPHAYFLYEIKSDRGLSDFFSDLSSGGSMVDYLNPLYKTELTLFGEMPLPVEITDNSKYSFDISIDSHENIIFKLGDHTNFSKSYVATVSGGIRELN